MENLIYTPNPWILTIIGGIIVTILGYFVLGIGKEKKNTKDESLNSQKENQNNLIISPKEIFESIEILPPAQREEISKNYSGIKISWHIKLMGISNEDQHFRVAGVSTYNNYNNVLIIFNVPKIIYPELKIIKENHELIVEGVIERIDISLRLIGLKNCKLTILNHSKKLK